MWLIPLLFGCSDWSRFALYDRDYYEHALLRWQDNDGDGLREVDGDCDDTRIDVLPGADERCDGLDDDCDGTVDVEAIDATAWYQDRDHDGFGNLELKYVACEAPTGFVSDATDCDDEDAETWPGAPESCDEAADTNCDGQPGNLDADHDGYRACEDCNDASNTVHPNAEEQCNGGIDDDCDGTADGADALGATEWYTDADNDGYGVTTDTPLVQCLAPASYSSADGDCDDESAEVNPGNSEICDNGLDDNCSGDADGSHAEGLLEAGGRLTTDGLGRFYGVFGPGDLDGDGRGDLVVGATTVDHPN